MTGRKIMAFAVVTILWAWWMTPMPAALAQEKKMVRISGAGLLSDVVQTFADEYVKDAPTCSFVVTGATTGIGFQKLMDAEVDVAMVTRKITGEEVKTADLKGLTLNSKLIGYVGLAVITNIKNSVSELTMEQLAKIFKGEVSNWTQVGGPNEPIRITVRAVPETGAGVLFQEKVLKGAPYSKDSVVMNSYNTTVLVCSKSYAIGYIPTTTVFFDKLEERGVKLIKIKKDESSAPYQLAGGISRETLYPISVPFLLYWNAKSDNPCIRAYVDFSEKQTQ